VGIGVQRRKFGVRLVQRGLLAGIITAASLISPRSCPAADAVADSSKLLIGYSEFRTNLPGGRHANVITNRACVVRADGTDRRRLAEELARQPNTWTSFSGWSLDGKQAIIGKGWESPDNARWEEKHQEFRFTTGGWLLDALLVDVKSGKVSNLTEVERVSSYNSGLFFWPNDPNRLGFQALIDGKSHPYSMDRDGRNKRDLTKDSREFTYGFSSSPDGRRISYHKDYQVYIADADGSNAVHVDTGHPHHFVPQWSPDGKWLMFLAGEQFDKNPYLVAADGSGLRKLGSRNGCKGWVAFLDVPDFHLGSSDLPTWSPDSRWICYTAKVKGSAELFRTSLEGETVQLTHTEPGTLHYHPQVSANGNWITFGSQRSGVRQIYVMNMKTLKSNAVTQVQPGWGAMWSYWQPLAQAARD